MNYGIADRMINAIDTFLDMLEEISGCSHDEAVKVFNLYRDLKLVKLDAVIGRYSVKHGAYLDKEVIQNAINS
jgi:hypothetical protein